MKIVALNANNFKRLKAVEIHPDGSVVLVRGKNRQGKTSVMDAIWAALGGKRAVPGKPIRDGERESNIRLDIGQYVVTRTFTEKDSYLTLKSVDGGTVRNPQELLDGLLESISFDPMEFDRQKPADQAKRLAQITGIDFAPMNKKRADLYAQRTEVNRTVKRCEARVETFKQVFGEQDLTILEGTKEEPDLMAEYEAANVAHMAFNNHKNAVRQIATEIKAKQDRVAQLQFEIQALEVQIEAALSALSKANDEVVFTEEFLPDLDAIKVRMQEQRTRQEQIGQAKEWKRILEDENIAITESAALSSEIVSLDIQRSEMMAKAQLPIEGLTFDEDGVTYNGIPFAECSSSERLRVSMAIAMGTNPKLRIIRIMDGSLLDKESMGVIEAMATADDFQVWVERVEDKQADGTYADGPGIIIEDGAVVAPKE